MGAQKPAPEAVLKCREPDCGESIIYKRRAVLGLGGYRSDSEPEMKTLYLTCPNGHTHRYEVRA